MRQYVTACERLAIGSQTDTNRRLKLRWIEWPLPVTRVYIQVWMTLFGTQLYIDSQ